MTTRKEAGGPGEGSSPPGVDRLEFGMPPGFKKWEFAEHSRDRDGNWQPSRAAQEDQLIADMLFALAEDETTPRWRRAMLVLAADRVVAVSRQNRSLMEAALRHSTR